MLVVPEEEIQSLQVMGQEQFQARMQELINQYQLPNYE